MLEYGALVAHETNGLTPLLSAVKHGSAPFIRLLLAAVDPKEARFFVNMVSSDHLTAVDRLIRAPPDPAQCAILAMLVASRAEIDPSRSIHAVASADSALLRALAQHGVNWDQTFENGETALFAACAASQFETAECLLALGVDVNRPCVSPSDSAGATPLHAACAESDSSISELLLRSRANARACDATARTALHVACSSSASEELVRLLLQSSVSVNATDRTGSTALSCACRVDDDELVLLLLDEFGADVKVGCEVGVGSTPLEIARRSGFEDVEDILLAHGAKD